MYFMRCWEKRPGMYSESELLEKSSNGALSAHNSAGPAFGVNLQQSCRSRHSKPLVEGVMLSNPVVLNCVPPNDSQSKQFAVPLSCMSTKLNNELMSAILVHPRTRSQQREYVVYLKAGTTKLISTPVATDPDSAGHCDVSSSQCHSHRHYWAIAINKLTYMFSTNFMSLHHQELRCEDHIIQASAPP